MYGPFVGPVFFWHHSDPRSGQGAMITNILYSMDGPRAYWLQFADGSKYCANLAHICAA